MTVPVEADPPAISNHAAHPKHTLKLVAEDGLAFTCKGCKRPGVGTRYRCKRCDFNLHTCCAVAPDRLTHPAFGDRVFTFLQAPEPLRATTEGKRDKSGGRSCAVCGKLVRGFVYHCFDEDLDVDLHPCCARLPEEHAIIRDDGRASALGKEAAATRRRETSDDDDRSKKVRRLPAARHRGYKLDPPAPAEVTQLNNRVSDLRRREVSRPAGDTSGNGNSGRGRAPAARKPY